MYWLLSNFMLFCVWTYWCSFVVTNWNNNYYADIHVVYAMHIAYKRFLFLLLAYSHIFNVAFGSELCIWCTLRNKCVTSFVTLAITSLMFALHWFWIFYIHINWNLSFKCEEFIAIPLNIRLYLDIVFLSKNEIIHWNVMAWIPRASGS